MEGSEPLAIFDRLNGLIEEPMVLFSAGMYRKALPKFEFALAVAEKGGEEDHGLPFRTWPGEWREV